jgi:hypothetical protein
VLFQAKKLDQRKQDSRIERSGNILQMGPKQNITDVFQAAPQTPHIRSKRSSFADDKGKSTGDMNRCSQQICSWKKRAISTRFSLVFLLISRPGVAIRKRDFGLARDWKHEIRGRYQNMSSASTIMDRLSHLKVPFGSHRSLRIRPGECRYRCRWSVEVNACGL